MATDKGNTSHSLAGQVLRWWGRWGRTNGGPSGASLAVRAAHLVWEVSNASDSGTVRGDVGRAPRTRLNSERFPQLHQGLMGFTHGGSPHGEHPSRPFCLLALLALPSAKNFLVLTPERSMTQRFRGQSMLGKQVVKEKLWPVILACMSDL